MTVSARRETISARLARIRAQKADRDREAWFDLLQEKFVVLTGTRGMGKSSSGVYLAYQLREMFGREVVAVGATMGITPEFGPHTFLSLEDFVCQLRMMSRAASQAMGLRDTEAEVLLLNQRGCTNQQHDPAYIQLANGAWRLREKSSEKAVENAIAEGIPCWSARNGVILYGSTILLDEAKQFLSGKFSSNPAVRLIYGFIQIMRHLHVTLIAMTPLSKDIGPDAIDQIDTWGQCVTFKDLREPYTKIMFSSGRLHEKVNLSFDPRHVWPMYKSDNLLTIRESHLNIKQKHL